jgi:hypothetical protein
MEIPLPASRSLPKKNNVEGESASVPSFVVLYRPGSVFMSSVPQQVVQSEAIYLDVVGEY